MTEPRVMRRPLGLTILACLAGAGLALFATTRAWAVDVAARPAPLPPVTTVHTGAALLPWLPPIAVVALAGAGALLATRRTARVVVGILLAAAGMAIAAGGVYGLAVEPGGWPVLCAAGGAVVAAAGAVTVARGKDWPSLGTRYERTQRDDRPDNLWDALDRGEDPTAD